MKLLWILAAGAMARVSNTFFEMHADFAEGVRSLHEPDFHPFKL